MSVHRTSPKAAVRRLATARLISITGGAAAYTALMFTVYERTRSPAWLSATLVLTFGVTGLLAPIAGAIGDRFDRRRVMIVSDLAGVAAFAGMAWAGDRRGAGRGHRPGMGVRPERDDVRRLGGPRVDRSRALRRGTFRRDRAPRASGGVRVHRQGSGAANVGAGL